MKDVNLGVSVNVTVGSAEVTFEIKKGIPQLNRSKLLTYPKQAASLNRKGRKISHENRNNNFQEQDTVLR